mmetsp:Transcript_93634/g.303101  ORF Transcript_93634/g.303101 Transcript_93634/m.303101 type:complete len:253 (+) Transcript_93634:805-1563(+)
MPLPFPLPSLPSMPPSAPLPVPSSPFLPPLPPLPPLQPSPWFGSPSSTNLPAPRSSPSPSCCDPSPLPHPPPPSEPPPVLPSARPSFGSESKRRFLDGPSIPSSALPSRFAVSASSAAARSRASDANCVDTSSGNGQRLTSEGNSPTPSALHNSAGTPAAAEIKKGVKASRACLAADSSTSTTSVETGGTNKRESSTQIVGICTSGTARRRKLGGLSEVGPCKKASTVTVDIVGASPSLTVTLQARRKGGST